MSAISSFVFFLLPFTLFFLFTTASGSPDLSYRPVFSFLKFEDAGNDLGLTLFGDARILRDDSAIRITNGSSPSSGRVLYKNPVRMFQGKRRIPMSFFSVFSFSISPGDGGRLAFAFAPRKFPFELANARNEGFSSMSSKEFVVEFDALSCLISIRVNDTPTVGLVVNSGERLNCWIEYDSSSRLMEVRIGNASEFRRFSPVISYSADLSKFFEDEMFVCISASSANSSQIATLYSWSFSRRYSAFTLHSEPVDPRNIPKFSKESAPEPRKSNVVGMFGAPVLGVACGAMAAMVLLLLRSRFAKKNSIAKTEFAAHRADFGYEKINVVGDRSLFETKN